MSEQLLSQFDTGDSFDNAVDPNARASMSDELPHWSTDNLIVSAFCSSEAPLYPPRLRRIPRHFQDVPPSNKDIDNLDNVYASDRSRNTAPPQSRIQRVLLTLRDTLQTNFNSLGLCRLYPHCPSFEPDQFVLSSLLSTTCPIAPQETDSGIFPPPYPFPNMTVYRLMSWMNSGSNKKSETEVARLVKEVMLAQDFDLKHLEDFSVRGSLRELDNLLDPSKSKIEFPDDWIQADVTINIPTKSKDDEARPFSVPGFHFRPLLEVIRSAFTDIQASAFHLSPFRRLWKDPLDDHQERVFDELYTSDSWLGGHTVIIIDTMSGIVEQQLCILA